MFAGSEVLNVAMRIDPKNSRHRNDLSRQECGLARSTDVDVICAK